MFPKAILIFLASISCAFALEWRNSLKPSKLNNNTQISLLDAAGIPRHRIVIPAEVKLEIRDKLDYINISERMIYPGLDGICKWITRRYAALGPLYNSKMND